MTCIAGLVAGDRVWIGGDSAGVSGWSLIVRADPKVFVTGPFLIGFTSSFRMGQLLRFNFDTPIHRPGENLTAERLASADPYKFMATNFVDAVRKCLNDGGYAKKDNGREEAGTFLVGFAGRLFTLDDDYQVGESADGHAAVGCGAQVANGSLHTTARLGPQVTPQDRLTWALEAAERFSAGVRGPFRIDSIARPHQIP